MLTRVGINGFGRIGRQSLRPILERCPDGLQVAAWYNNEGGYICRIADFTHSISEALV